MLEVAIIGAGELGGATAHLLARRDLASRVQLVDDRGRVAEGKALDIMQAAPVEQFTTTVAGSTDLTAAGGADVVIVADRAAGAEWQGDDGLLLVRRLAGLAPSAIIVCAGWSQRDLLDRVVRELHLDRRRVLGSAPEALASAARALVALELDGSPQDITLAVLGNPPSHTIILWDDAAIGGYPLTRFVDGPTRKRLVSRIAAIGPPGPHALAAAVGKVVDAIEGRSKPILSCFVATEETGRRTRTIALPVRLGAAGVEAVVLPKLNVADQVALDNVMLL